VEPAGFRVPGSEILTCFPASQEPEILSQIADNTNLGGVPDSWEPDPGFHFQEPGTHSVLPQNVGKNMSKHSNGFKSVQKQIVRWVPGNRTCPRFRFTKNRTQVGSGFLRTELETDTLNRGEL
jgi:hypothetical protein